VRETKTTIEPTDVEWLCQSSKWSENIREPDHKVFVEEAALAHLLLNDVVFLNSHWWRDDAPKDMQEVISVNVICNDVFAWGCADAEALPHDEIENLYRMWIADTTWGAAKWCAIRRKQQPQKPVIAAMKKAGAWDDAMEALAPNTMDREVKAQFAAAMTKPDPTRRER
jgi:hypothetical protein